jgi:hypothetical protein
MENPVHKKDKVDVFIFDTKTKMMEKMKGRKKVEIVKK